MHCDRFDVLNMLVQIIEVATLKAAWEEDLKACGLKMGEIMRIRRVLDMGGFVSNEEEIMDEYDKCKNDYMA